MFGYFFIFVYKERMKQIVRVKIMLQNKTTCGNNFVREIYRVINRAAKNLTYWSKSF